jgi:hypothetical protein
VTLARTPANVSKIAGKLIVTFVVKAQLLDAFSTDCHPEPRSAATPAKDLVFRRSATPGKQTQGASAFASAWQTFVALSAVIAEYSSI